MRIPLIFCLLFVSSAALCQTRISFNNDLSVFRNFSESQQFWAIGHTIEANVHLKPRISGYVNFNYYTPGTFKNQFTATAKPGTSGPPVIDFEAKAKWSYRQLAFGWKQYLLGNFENETSWSLYTKLGVGLMWSECSNGFFPGFNPADYTTPVKPFEGSFSRLTVDLGLGWERSVGGNFFLYFEGRSWVPTTKTPSGFIHDNSVQVPLCLGAHVGLRILFGYY